MRKYFEKPSDLYDSHFGRPQFDFLNQSSSGSFLWTPTVMMIRCDVDDAQYQSMLGVSGILEIAQADVDARLQIIASWMTSDQRIAWQNS